MRYPDGKEVAFARNSDGTFTAPAGRFATLKEEGSHDYTLVDKDGTRYGFRFDLAWKLGAITDANGRSLVFNYDPWTKKLTSITSASGRKLYLTWVDGRVTEVSTDRAVASDPASVSKWTYTYEAGKLTKVCPPTSSTACTRYEYGTNWLYPTAVTDAGPHTYLRLNEPNGPTAHSEPVDSEDAATGTYRNVVFGQPGRVPGASGNSVEFNGTSSSIELDSAKVALDATHQTVSMWFKTNRAARMVLLSYQDDDLSASTTTKNFTPSLYIWSNGKLYGQFANGSSSAMESAGMVTDDQWHHVALVAAGTTQSMYLDGALVDSRAGQITTIDESSKAHQYLGAGFLGGVWGRPPEFGNALTHFDGYISDYTFYTKPLTAAQIQSIRSAGLAASAPLTKIIQPSNRVAAEITYRSSGEVETVKDANGGTWTINPATVTGSAQIYAASVLSAGPADYWRLADTGSPQFAVNEVNGGQASFNLVELGQPGPFEGLTPARSAAKFNGTSSYIRLPADNGGLSGPNSISMWFNTSGSGVLYGYQSHAIPASPSGGWVPALYVGTDGKLRGEFWNGAIQPITTKDPVNDGKWHHVLLAASTNSQTLYLDGKRVGSLAGPLDGSCCGYAYVGAGTLTSWPSGSGGEYFSGSIAEVAFYRSELMAGDAMAQFTAYHKTTGAPTRNVTLLDPNLKPTVYRYDALNGRRLVEQVDALGGRTVYGYDVGGFLRSTTDANGNMVVSGHDGRGNVASYTTCQDRSANKCSTFYYTYELNPADPVDPRNDRMLTMRDGRSTSAADNRYLTSFSYDAKGNLIEVTDPLGRKTKTDFTDGLPTRVTTPGGAERLTSYLANGDAASELDAAGLKTEYTYDGLGRVKSQRIVRSALPLEDLVTFFEYDKLGRLRTQTDPAVRNRVTGATHTKVSTTIYDDDGNVTSVEAKDTTGGDATRAITAIYNQYGQRQSETDPLGKTRQFSYDSFGRVLTQADANGTTVRIGYDELGNQISTTLVGYTGNPNAPQIPADVDLEVREYDPAGRLRRVIDKDGLTADGFSTEYTYTDNGMLASVVRRDPAPDPDRTYVVESNTYDEVGNLVSKTTNNGVTLTNIAVDASSRPTEVVANPSGVNRKTTFQYTLDSGLKTLTVSDGFGSKTTDASFDLSGRKTVEAIRGSGSGGPDGWWKLDNFTGTKTLDSTSAERHATATDNVSWAQDGAAVLSGGNIFTNGSVLDTTNNFTVSSWVKVADTGVSGTIVAQDANFRSAFELYYAGGDNWGFVKPYGDGNWGGAWLGGAAVTATSSWMHVVAVYDRAAGAARLYVNGILLDTQVAAHDFASAGSLTIGRGKYNHTPGAEFEGSIDNVQVYQRAASSSDVSALFAKGRDGGTLSTAIATSWSYDRRGLAVAETDPNGNTTTYDNDEAGRRTVTIAPTMTAEEFGVAAAQVVPVTTIGYDTFGAEVETKDAKNRQVQYVRDANGQVIETRLPSNAGMNPVYKTVYDNSGQVIETEDPLLHKTSYVYDQLGRLAKATAPDEGVTTYTYDLLGNVLSQTDPVGAKVEAKYDFLGRQVETKQFVGQPSAEYKTTFDYHDFGPLRRVTSPNGVKTEYGYNAVGEKTSVLDPAGQTTLIEYGFAGRQTKVTAPDLSKQTVEYDIAGRPIIQRVYAPSNGAELASRSLTYDNNGNVLTSTDFRGNTTTFTYDATGQLTKQVEPITATDSITTTFGHDASGKRTRFTDGRGSQFWTTYNNWGLEEKQIEPATAAFPNLSDRTFTTNYDLAGRVASKSLPGGVSNTYTYDDMNRVTLITGAGAEAATSDRTFGYDKAGHVTSLSGSGGTNTLSYDERGLLLSVTGPSGNSSFGYRDDGRMTSRVDAAGTTTYDYDSAGRLASASNPGAGVQSSYTYSVMSQVETITYGGNGNKRILGYDNRHRLASDELKTPGGASIGKIAYGWDANGNEKSKTTTGFLGTYPNTYTYDRANRLTSWYNGYDTVNYAYDKSGNRIQAASKTLTYNERNQLVSSPSLGTTYQYTARGTMRKATTGTVGLDTLADAFGQVVKQYHSATAFSEYSYDGLGRAIKAGFAYTGLGNDLASDDTATYTRDPAGGLLGVKQGTASTLAWTDLHTDVVGQFTATGSTLSGSVVYDPLGKVTATSGMIGNLGYQSEWTDFSTGRVNMHARWYNPETGQFDSRDSWTLSPTPASANANRHAYANSSPLTNTDPTGHYNDPGYGEGGGTYTPTPPPITPDPAVISPEYSARIGWQVGQLPPGPAVCGHWALCFLSGLRVGLGSMTMEDIEGLRGFIDKPGEGIRSIAKQAQAWSRKLGGSTEIGWMCVLTGFCEAIDECRKQISSSSCAFQIGSAIGLIASEVISWAAGPAAAVITPWLIIRRFAAVSKEVFGHLPNLPGGKKNSPDAPGGHKPNIGQQPGTPDLSPEGRAARLKKIDDYLERKTPKPPVGEKPPPPPPPPPKKKTGGGNTPTATGQVSASVKAAIWRAKACLVQVSPARWKMRRVSIHSVT